MRDYLPRRESELADWARLFAEKIAAAPADYGLGAEVAAQIAVVVEAYVQALAVASAPATRTKANVAAKNSAKAAMLRVVRAAAQQIRVNPAVDETLKVGLKLRLPGRAANGTPDVSERPFLHLRALEPLRHVLGYGQGEGLGKARPAGAIGLQIFMHVGDAAPADPLEASFLRFVSRPPLIVDFKSEQIGQTAYYYARWQSATGATSPWSQVLRMTVAG